MSIDNINKNGQTHWGELRANNITLSFLSLSLRSQEADEVLEVCHGVPHLGQVGQHLRLHAVGPVMLQTPAVLYKHPVHTCSDTLPWVLYKHPVPTCIRPPARRTPWPGPLQSVPC